jgi:hypothetical protein
MNQEEVFSVWAPQGSIWSRWVAPVLFAQTYWDTRIKSEPVTPQHLIPPWLSIFQERTLSKWVSRSLQLAFAQSHSTTRRQGLKKS